MKTKLRFLLFLVALEGAAGIAIAEPEIFDFGLEPSGTNVVIHLDQAVASNTTHVSSSLSPQGPFYFDPNAELQSGNDRFVTSLRDYHKDRFFRVESTPGPYIRFIAPNEGRAGYGFSLLGERFDPTPAGNTVVFSLPDVSYTATVTAASTTVLGGMVPAGLPTPAPGDNVAPYAVSVTTTNGKSNAVGFTPDDQAPPDLAIRPSQAAIIVDPGTGIETYLVGGGSPPYTLLPLSATDQTRFTAQLIGSVIHVQVISNQTWFWPAGQVKIEDSLGRIAQAGVVSRPVFYGPSASVTFHSLLEGSAPSFQLDMSVAGDDQRTVETVVRFEGITILLDSFFEGQVIGHIESRFNNLRAFSHLQVTGVQNDWATFDVWLDGGDELIRIAQGEIAANPPSVAIHVLDIKRGSREPIFYEQTMFFESGLFRLPDGAGQAFAAHAEFVSSSIREDIQQPRRQSHSSNLVTTGVAMPGAPRLEQVTPQTAGAGRYLRLAGSGFETPPATNNVTFTAMGGERIPAHVIHATSTELVVEVPASAITGPLRVTQGGNDSNDYAVRLLFHPDATVTFDSFSSTTASIPRIQLAQPWWDPEFSFEIAFQRAITTFDAGSINVSGLTSNQNVGTVTLTNQESGTSDPYVIRYRGEDPDTPGVHLFEPEISSPTYAFRLSAGEGGTGAVFEVRKDLHAVITKWAWDIAFNTPLYTPPAVPGTEVFIQTELISEPWTSMPGNELKQYFNELRIVE